ncbi:MAG: family 78 glycoside hydrolase catalytic domain [Clostridia bacterium]|nr:family 78 glycoside hydrolase catalytic domain [Clostridia bacterium]
MNQSECAKWIWCADGAQADEYGEFYSSFIYSGGKAELMISADSNYAVYLNGALAAFGQYADYPYDKIYDTADVTSFCREGENHLAVVVWYYGIHTTSVYYPGNAAVMFALTCAGKCVCASSADTLSRKSPAYAQHRKKILTGQLGLSFLYDAAKEDAWKTGGLQGFSRSAPVAQALPLRKRPCERLILERPVYGKLCKTASQSDLIFDLGINTVGFLKIEAVSERAQTLLISYGEHLADGVVRRRIGSRDFSVEIGVRRGETVYMNPFRRLGCKYIEVQSEFPLKEIRVSIVPTVYPVREKERPRLTAAQKAIYDICERTLRLCMHEHYEDCPWREQALYAMDSRNQMLCGYYAFGETRFPRANLELMSRDDRADGLLSICYPIRMDLVIPSFSLHYFTACAEYLRYSGDEDFLRGIYPKLQSVLSVFLSKMEKEGDVIFPFQGCWNFYEWRGGLDGNGSTDLSEPDLILNGLLSIALQRMAEISDRLGADHAYGAAAAALNASIRTVFYDSERELFRDRNGKITYSVLGNSIAVLCGACEKERAVSLCEAMKRDASLIPISLSMKCFFYDACLHADRERYGAWILDDIGRCYLPMVEYGVGTVWETELGERDFNGAGSLCHGWSALPIYYYHTLL